MTTSQLNPFKSEKNEVESLNRISITASNTMNQLQKQMDTIANNIANSQTTGYKKQRATFGELMYQQYNNQRNLEEEVNRLTPNGIRIGTGARVAQVQTVLTLGSIVQTGRALDFALTEPNQFFKVLAPKGNETAVHYTRDGSFYLSPVNANEVGLVTSEGYQVLDENNNPIIFNNNLQNVNLNPNGEIVFSDEAGNNVTFNLGIAQIHKPQTMARVGDNLMTLPDNMAELGITEADLLENLAGNLRGQIGLKNQALEQSNVDIGEEMTNLLQTQRAYQLQGRAITIADQMQGLINGIR